MPASGSPCGASSKIYLDMSQSNLFSVIWASDEPEQRATQIRAAAAAWSWKQDRSKKSSSKNRTPNQPQRRPQSRRTTNKAPIPPTVTTYDPSTRLFATFFPRFISLIGPDAHECIRRTILPSDDALVRETYDALIVGVSSNLSFDEQLKGSAVRRYGGLLPRMTSRLQDVRIAKSTATSSIIFLLGVEEAMVWKSFKSSQTHIQGWGRLIQMRGPESFTSPADLFTLRMFRMNAVALHLLSRQPCFLASSEWRTIPWTHEPKNLFDHSMDLLVQIPGLVAQVDLFRKGELQPAVMDTQVRSFIQQLQSFRDEILCPAFADLLPHSSDDPDLDTCISSLSPATFTLARGLAHYIAAILLISRFGPRYTALLPYTPEEAANGIAEICETMALSSTSTSPPSSTSPEAPVAALWPWIQPLRIACLTPTGTEETGKMLQEVCRRLERKFEWKILGSERYETFKKGGG